MTDMPGNDALKPSVPTYKPPPGACDCHAHVFGSRERYATVEGAPYEAPQASVDAYVAMLDLLGLTRGILVQPAIYGFDNAAFVDALRRFPARLRGVGLADRTIGADRLADCAAAGMKGLRFAVFAKGAENLGGVSIDEIPALAPQMNRLGLHAQVWAAPELLVVNGGIKTGHVAA